MTSVKRLANETRERVDPSGHVTRRGFIRRVGSALVALVGVTGLSLARVQRAEAASVMICDGCLLVCGWCNYCHQCDPDGSGCCSGAYPRDWYHKKINDSGVERQCTGESGGPCCGSPKYCYGGPPGWSSPFTSDYCCLS